MLPPCQHISIHSPGLQRPVLWVGVESSNIGIAINRKINLGQISQILLIACGTRQRLLKERVSLLPGGLYLGYQPLQPAPFLLKASSLVSGLHRASKKGLDVIWKEYTLITRPSRLASP